MKIEHLQFNCAKKKKEKKYVNGIGIYTNRSDNL